jgi:hypothetical protein
VTLRSIGRGSGRGILVWQALALDAASIVWMVAEPAFAIASALAAHSLTLLAFGLDGAIELASASVLTWRLIIELTKGRDVGEVAERLARRIAGSLLFILATYVCVSAVLSLWQHKGAQFSLFGLIVASVEIPVMYALAWAKLRVADGLGSRALRADAAQATTCTYLAASVVVGMIAQRLFSGWWVDGATSLAIVAFLIKEGAEAWSPDRASESLTGR